MKQIDIGGLSFAEIREKDKYYVDKTLLIKDILDSNAEGIYLFTRPRRFGKTTNLSMLDAFFNVKYKGNTWFDNLEISKHPEYGKYKNAYPVICINLLDTKVATLSSFVNKVRIILSNVFEGFSYLKEFDGIDSTDLEMFKKTRDMTIEEDFISGCVPMLCKLLERYHGVKPIILIDEYDRAVSDAFGSDSHRPMMDFLGEFMSAMLKSSDHLQMGVVTGVMQIAKESIFSGLNNLEVNNIFSVESDERYGFTEQEVKQICSDYGHPEKFEEAKEWYDGYRFGNSDIYNPYSIMKYISKGFKPQKYWMNTGGDWIIRWMFRMISGSNFERILDLSNGGSFSTRLLPSLKYDAVKSGDNYLYSLMAMSGYLKAIPAKGEDIYDVSAPNHEVRKVLGYVLEDEVAPIRDDLFLEFNRAVLDGDADTMVADLQQILLSASYLNLNAENAYGLILMTIMHQLIDRYDVRTENEAGNGRTDIILRPKNEGTVPIIFELKRENEEKDLGPGVDDAIAQIHKKRYYLGMKGKVILVGMAFWGKIPKARVETIDNGPDGTSFSLRPAYYLRHICHAAHDPYVRIRSSPSFAGLATG